MPQNFDILFNMFAKFYAKFSDYSWCALMRYHLYRTGATLIALVGLSFFSQSKDIKNLTPPCPTSFACLLPFPSTFL